MQNVKNTFVTLFSEPGRPFSVSIARIKNIFLPSISPEAAIDTVKMKLPRIGAYIHERSVISLRQNMCCLPAFIEDENSFVSGRRKCFLCMTQRNGFDIKRLSTNIDSYIT